MALELLKLGLMGLSAEEMQSIESVFRLHRVDPSFIWSLSSAAPFDALLVDALLPAQRYLDLVGRDTCVQRVSETGVADLHRPIQPGKLLEWLRGVEIDILHGKTDRYSSTLVSRSNADD